MTSFHYQTWLVFLTILTVVPTSVLHADDDDDDELRFMADEVVVKLNPLTGGSIQEIHTRYGTSTLSTMLESAGIYLIRPPEGIDLEDFAEQLTDDERLLYAEPNYIASVPQSGGHVIWAWSGGPPVLGNFPDEIIGQAPMQSLELPSVHPQTTGNGVVVAVLDTGIDFSHPNLSASLLESGYDFVDDDADPQDRRMNLDADGDGLVDENFGHGTHVAGTVLIAAPDALVLPVRVLDAEGRGNIFTLAEAIDHAVDAGAHVINLSLGMDFESDLLEEAIERAVEADVLVVAAAGNGNTNQPNFPAANDDVIGVASVDENGIKSSYTNWGWWIAVSAPGETVVSAFPDNTYAAWSGTSMAAPLVAGQAALLKAVAPNLDVYDLIDVITGTAVDIDPLNPGWQEMLGAGRIDLAASVEAARSDLPGGEWTEGSLAELVNRLESGEEEDLNIRVTGILGERLGGSLDADEDYRFSDGSGVTVLLSLDAFTDVAIAMPGGTRFEVLGELESIEEDEAPGDLAFELEAVRLRLADGTELDIGPQSPLAGSIISDWAGFFWRLDKTGWFFHPSKGVLFDEDAFGEEGWFFSLNRNDWMYAIRGWYPYVYSNAEGWYYLIGSPYGGLQHAYSFSREQWVLNFWRMEP